MTADKQKVEMKTYWNGEPCEAKKVLVKVGKSARPTWWCADLEGKTIEAVKITQGSYSFFVPDEKETWLKITEGFGSPTYPHKGLPDSTVELTQTEGGAK